jgi:hypothetical protein
LRKKPLSRWDQADCEALVLACDAKTVPGHPLETPEELPSLSEAAISKARNPKPLRRWKSNPKRFVSPAKAEQTRHDSVDLKDPTPAPKATSINKNFVQINIRNSKTSSITRQNSKGEPHGSSNQRTKVPKTNQFVDIKSLYMDMLGLTRGHHTRSIPKLHP